MKTLSIRHPWAWLIIHAGKDIENRQWNSRYRGPLLIHASASFTRAEYKDALDTATAIGVANFPTAEHLKESSGGIIGVVDIIDCVDKSDSPWFFGKYGLCLTGARALPFTPCKGQLGIWNYEGKIAGI